MKRVTKQLWKPLMTVLVLVTLVGGPAYAAGLAKNSVRSKHIKDGEVKTLDLGDGAVTGTKVADNTLSSDDLAFSSVDTTELADGAVTTSKIFPGSATDTRLGQITVRTNDTTVNAGSAAIITAACDAGETALGGGGTWNGASTVGPVYLAQVDIGGTSGANGGPSQVTVTGRNDGGAARTLTAQVNCLA